MRKAPFTAVVERRAATSKVDLNKFGNKSVKAVRKEVTEQRKALWAAQKTCESDRMEWLKEVAIERAAAEGDKEWRDVLKEMLRTAETRAVNRKLGAITKGRSKPLDRIETPNHDWFFSEKANELYHHDQGNFEAYPSIDGATGDGGRYYLHHTLKVLPPDAVKVLVGREEDHYKVTSKLDWYYSFSANRLFHMVGGSVDTFGGLEDGTFRLKRPSQVPRDATAAIVERTDMGTYKLLDTLPIPARMWCDVTSQEKIETMLMARNKRHLQQTAIEGGESNGPVMTELTQDHGLSEMADKLLAGTYETEHEVSEELAEWFRQMKQTDKERESPKIVGVMTKPEFQYSFKIAREKTSSSPSGLHYTIWKAMASSDYCAEFLCIMVSLPFMYGFVNKRWTREIDVMLEKKKGVRKIHMLRIIGLVEADFNTALKFFLAKQMQQASEANGLSDEQHGSRQDRTSIDAGMIKLLTFENARLKRSTVIETSYDKKACFDRMQTGQSDLYAQKQNVEKNLLRCRSMCVKGMRRHLKTGLGVSIGTYQQDDG